MKKLSFIFLVILIITLISSCDRNQKRQMKIVKNHTGCYLLAADTALGDERISVKNGFLFNKESNLQLSNLKKKKLVIILSDASTDDTDDNNLVIPISKEGARALGYKGQYYYLIDTIREKKIIENANIYETKILQAYGERSKTLIAVNHYQLIYSPNKFRGEVKLLKTYLSFSDIDSATDWEPKLSEESVTYRWPFLELITSAIFIFWLARFSMTKIKDKNYWDSDLKKKFKKNFWIGIGLILFNLVLPVIIWGNMNTVDVIGTIILLTLIISFLSFLIGAMFSFLFFITNPKYYFLLWLIFTSLLINAFYLLFGLSWQIFIPGLGYFAWLWCWRKFRISLRKSE